MATLGGTIEGWLFFAATLALFGWGLYLGARGLRAHHPPFRPGASAPRAEALPGRGAA